MRARIAALGGLALLVGAGPAPGAQSGPPIPAPSGFVTDKAEIIESDREGEIVSLLEELERRTGAEVAVLTMQSTQPADEREYALRVFDRWRVGKAGTRRGVLVLVAVQDRRVSILPGPSVKRLFPEERINRIIDSHFVPAFKKGHYGRGILEGTWAIAEQIAIDARIKLDYEPSLTGEQNSRTTRMATFRRILSLLVLLLITGILWAVWKEYRGRGEIRSRGGRGDSGSPGDRFRGGGGGGFGGGARGW